MYWLLGEGGKGTIKEVHMRYKSGIQKFGWTREASIRKCYTSRHNKIWKEPDFEQRRDKGQIREESTESCQVLELHAKDYCG